ncbi:MAG TPA: TonB family protein [Candidatus Polarisedimenticolaceae bacterium]
MISIRAAAAVVALAACAAASAAELEEARRLLDEYQRPVAAVEAVRTILNEDPLNVQAQILHARALERLDRSGEAVPFLENWATSAPTDARPLTLLTAAYASMKDAAGLASVRDRAAGLDEPARRDVRRALVLGQLAASQWKEAADTLGLLTPIRADEAAGPLLPALDAARRGDRKTLWEMVEATPAPFDREDIDVAWWIQMLLDLSPPPADEPSPDGEKTARGLSEPIVVRKVAPVYPPEAKSAALEGVVTLQATLLRSGRVVEANVKESSDPIFDDAARRAVLRWRYKPVTQDGKPVSIYFTVVVRFKVR